MHARFSLDWGNGGWENKGFLSFGFPPNLEDKWDNISEKIEIFRAHQLFKKIRTKLVGRFPNFSVSFLVLYVIRTNIILYLN